MTVREISVEAFRQIIDEGLLSRRRMEIYTALFFHGPCAASELVRHIPGGRSNPTQSNVHARLGELRDLGVVRELDPVRCPSTGRMVIAWQTTGALPSKRSKPKHIKCTYCHGKGYVEQGRLF